MPLDPAEGAQYTELVRNYEEDNDIKKICTLTAQDEDWINPTIGGRITWEKDISYNSDSDEEFQHWQNQLHEVLSLCYNRLTKLL